MESMENMDPEPEAKIVFMTKFNDLIEVNHFKKHRHLLFVLFT